MCLLIRNPSTCEGGQDEGYWNLRQFKGGQQYQ